MVEMTAVGEKARGFLDRLEQALEKLPFTFVEGET